MNSFEKLIFNQELFGTSLNKNISMFVTGIKCYNLNITLYYVAYFSYGIKFIATSIMYQYSTSKE